MDLIVNSAEVVLAEELAYALPKTGSYVVDRKNCSFFPDSGGSYSPTNGTKVIRFRIASQGQWADFKTLKVMFDVSNTGADKTKPLLPIGRAHGFFKRLVISCRGVILEDISDFNAVSEMFYILNGGDSNKNNSVEEFGYVNNVKDRKTLAEYPGITNDNKTVSFTPMCGLIDIKKYLPLTYVPIEISLELADAPDPIVTAQAAGSTFLAADISTSWAIFNPIIKLDLLQLDNGLENSYVEHFSSGKSINIVYNTVVSTLQSTSTRSSQINVSRSLSKMTGVYMSLRNSNAAPEYHSKPWNTFYAPNKGNAVLTDAEVLATSFAKEDFTKIQLQIGSRLFPDTPIKSYSEAFSSLRKSLKIHGSDRDLHSVDINGLEYRTNKFIVGFPTDKISNLSFTGMNTRNNLITLNIDCEDAKKPTAVFVAITSQQILEISDTGCDVMD